MCFLTSASEFRRNSRTARSLNTSAIFAHKTVQRLFSRAPLLVWRLATPTTIQSTTLQVVGRADALCTLNRHFFNPLVRDYCRDRGVLIASDRAPRTSGGSKVHK